MAWVGYGTHALHNHCLLSKWNSAWNLECWSSQSQLPSPADTLSCIQVSPQGNMERLWMFTCQQLGGLGQQLAPDTEKINILVSLLVDVPCDAKLVEQSFETGEQGTAQLGTGFGR